MSSIIPNQAGWFDRWKKYIEAAAAVIAIFGAAWGAFWFLAANVPIIALVVATNGSPVLNNSLYDAQSSVWKAKNDGSGSCAFKDSTYVVSNSPDIGMSCFPSSKFVVSNFALRVQMKIHEGGIGGVVFRWSSGSDICNNYYYYFFSSDGKYGVYNSTCPDAEHHYSMVPLIDITNSQYIYPGLDQSNEMALIASGNTFKLFANGHFLATSQDTANVHSTGELGLTAGVGLRSAVSFSNIQIWLM